MNVAVSVLELLWMSVIQLFYLLGVLIAGGLLLGYLEKLSNSFLVRSFGMRGLLSTAWLGTPIHELGHLLMCFLWGHRVTRVKLLQLNSPDGVLGYVEHEYNRNSMYQRAGNFFIGIGPLFSGIAALLLGMYFLVPDSFEAFQLAIRQHLVLDQMDFRNILAILGEMAAAIAGSFFTMDHFLQPSFWLFLLIAISISSHMALSRADIGNSANGLATIFFILFLFNVYMKISGLNSYRVIEKIAMYNAYVLAFFSIAIFFSLFTLSSSALIYLFRKR